uniref:Uncharacterized protein n=1 Tax=Anguilla anguilla TaxID=7936 RepID=A0A0E9SF94_ANGAN
MCQNQRFLNFSFDTFMDYFGTHMLWLVFFFILLA